MKSITDFNNGTWNEGNSNIGNSNKGCHNHGSFNAGSYNYGSYNMGSFNTGHFNEGSCNKGSFNYGSYCYGYFNTQSCIGTEKNISCFNEETGLNDYEFRDKYRDILKEIEAGILANISNLPGHTSEKMKYFKMEF